MIDIPIDPVEFRNFDPSSLEAGRLGRIAISGADIVVDGTSESAGSIVIRGGTFLLNGGSNLTSFEPSPNDANGAIDIRVRGLLELGDGRLYTRTDSAENGVGIYLAGDIVTLSDTDVW
ncbi:MAG: hypothetical protein IH897_14705, partial [Planctomycetes bacterium]|nr:hypothetical protein [Planctomycetota bacterium]